MYMRILFKIKTETHLAVMYLVGVGAEECKEMEWMDTFRCGRRSQSSSSGYSYPLGGERLKYCMYGNIFESYLIVL